MASGSLSSICVYCGSSPGSRTSYTQTAEAFGRLLAAEGITIVYGGGNVGLMGALADGALAAGGKVIGVIQISRKGSSLAESGPEFTSSDLAKITALCKPLGQLIQHLCKES